jgi:4,5-DOPA dioxygenase extradiol
MENKETNVLYISHGGGPLPLLGDEGHKEMVESLKWIAAKIKKPSAILVISAHWEEKIPTITAGKNPPLFYDYYGFPDEAYEIQYPAPGEPGLASQVRQRLSDRGIESRLDEQRGFDHGLFIPLKIMYPQAAVPCIQLSLVQGLDPAAHIQIGRALAGINYEDLLVIGSGFSFHNIRAFFSPVTSESQAKNEAFERWLIDTCSNPEMDEPERTLRLVNWENAPSARYCHPREEHLLPLHVCYGLAQSACTQYFTLDIMYKKSSMYLWEISANTGRQANR